MVFLVTEQSLFVCSHAGNAERKPSQDFVRIEGARILVDPDPLQRSISACPWRLPGQKPCTNTVSILSGLSPFVHIAGHPVGLSSLVGLTDSVPPVTWQVSAPAQTLVRHP